MDDTRVSSFYKTDTDSNGSCLSFLHMESLRADLPCIRAFAGWSQTDISKMLGISIATYRAIEKTPFKMTRLHCLAILKLIDDACQVGPFAESLKTAIMALNRKNQMICRNEVIERAEFASLESGTKGGKKTIAGKLEAWILRGEIL